MATQTNPEPIKDPNDAYGPPNEDDAADVAEPPKPAPKPDPIRASPALRRAAKSLGISEDDIDQTSPDALEEAVSLMIEQNQQRERAKPAQKPVVEEDDDDALIESLSTDLSLDARLKALLKKSSAGSKQSKKEIAELKAALAERDTREHNRVIRASQDAVEDAIANLGEEYAPILGEGSLSSLKGDSKEAKRRRAIYSAAGINLATDSPATIQRKYTKEAKLQYGDFVGKAKAKEVEEEEEPSYQTPPRKPTRKKEGPDLGLDGHAEIDWKEAGTARPTNRKIVEPKRSDKAAVAAIRQSYQEKGIPGANGSAADTFDGIPE